jgi:DNA-directed RNA polymerase specialized sigma24 family protein
MTDADLAAFYEEIFLPLVRRATWRHGLSREDARDVVQDAFLLAIERIDAAKNPRAWLIQVVDHLSLNHQRKVLRRFQLAVRWGLKGEADQASLSERSAEE